MTTDDPRDNSKEYAENWKNSPYRKYVEFPVNISEEIQITPEINYHHTGDVTYSCPLDKSPSITYNSNPSVKVEWNPEIHFQEENKMEKVDEKVAVIFGATGQDGYYLTELLLEKRYKVVAVRRRSATNNAIRLEEFKSNENFSLVTGDVTDYSSILNILKEHRPIEIYNLAAQSHVGISFDQPQLTWEVTAKGCMNILEAIHFLHGSSYSPKFYQASTSEMFGDNYTGGKSKDLQGFYKYDDTTARFQDEDTPFNPQSPYAVAKLAAHHQTRLYRECYGMHASSGILFNHESPLRGENFVTRKITKYCARLKKYLDDNPVGVNHAVPVQDMPVFPKLMLGNLESRRDWGHARDYCINLDVPILTVDGWKYYDDIEIGDVIINFDSNNNRLSQDEVQKKVLLDTDGEKIRLSGRGVHLDVTHNHRIYYQQKSKTSKGGWSDWKVCTAIEFYDKLNRLASRTRYDYRLPHFQDYHSDIDLSINGLTVSDEMIYLMGILLSEGHLSSDMGNGNVVSISQSLIANEKVYNKIEDCIHKLDLEYRIRNRNDGVTEWLFNAESSKEILTWFDKNNVHIMPKWCYRLTQYHANVLIKAMMDGDGCWGSMTYTSKRYLLAVDFQSIAAIAGFRSTQIKKDKSVYRVCLITKRKKYTYIQSTDLINDGHTKVWCVTTKNGTIVTRDRDCISVSGNCEAMWLMLQQKDADDYVISKGHTHSIRELLDVAFGYIGVDDWTPWVGQDPKFMRPAEVEYLLGKSDKAKRVLGWTPKVTFQQLIEEMIDHDYSKE